MWVHGVSEGQTNDPPPEGTSSAESHISEPFLLAEGIPENLGDEWRVLHPFEIPGWQKMIPWWNLFKPQNT